MSIAQPRARRREGYRIFHEQTQLHRICGFQTVDAVFPKDPLFRLYRDHNNCRCAVWRP